ncbi:MAG: hypothetical protein PSV22_03585 [Pseudolabrys sp.]|nr:hypothetical protein [Pseudolabrys sp.]
MGAKQKPRRHARAATADIELLALRGSWTQAHAPARRKFLDEITEPLCSPRGSQTLAGLAVAPGARAEPRQELVGRFLSICTRAALGARVQASDLYKVFTAWAKATGEPLLTATALGRGLRACGARRLHSNVSYWLDLELLKSVDDFVGPRAPRLGARR